MEKNIARKHRGQSGQNLLGPPALTLEIDDIRLQKDRAAKTESRHRLGCKSGLRIALNRNAKVLCGRLQKVPVARRALRVELEIPDAALTQQNELDVLPAHIDDHMRIGKVMQCRFGVGHGFNQGHIGLQHLGEDILGVARCPQAKNAQACARILFHLPSQIAQHFNRIRNRVALREPIRLGQHFAALRQEHSLGGGGPDVQADKGLDLFVALKCCGNKLRRLVMLFERLQFICGSAEPRPPGSDRPLLVPGIEQALQRGTAKVAAVLLRFAHSEFDCSDRGKIQRIRRGLNQVFRRLARGELHAPFLPEQRYIVLPSLAHSAQKSIRPAQQQNLRHQRMAAGQHAEILQHNGVKQRGHQLGWRKPLLLQAVNVGLGKDAALARDRMDAHTAIDKVRQLIGGNLQLGLNLIDDRARAARALIVHRSDLPAPSAADFSFEKNDLGVLAAEFNHRLRFGMHLLNSERNSVHFLHESRANRRS